MHYDDDDYNDNVINNCFSLYNCYFINVIVMIICQDVQRDLVLLSMLSRM